MANATPPQIASVAELDGQPEEFITAIKKIVRSHAVNELQGARVFDEPAIQLAPTPYAKWLTCRVAMEEYHHHVRFKELGDELGIPEDQLVPGGSKAASTLFSIEMNNWTDFCVLKMLGDLAEILQVEDMLHCSFEPLRTLARTTMPEEKFHSQFGIDFTTEICKTEQGRKDVQETINRIMPLLPAFFGRPYSKNNEIYRKWGIKLRTNEDMRADYLVRATKLVDDLGLKMPELTFDDL